MFVANIRLMFNIYRKYLELKLYHGLGWTQVMRMMPTKTVRLSVGKNILMENQVKR